MTSLDGVETTGWLDDLLKQLKGQAPFTAPADVLTRTRPDTTLPGDRGVFVRVDISAVDAAHPSWSQPVRAYFKGDAGGWKLVGFERMPDAPKMRPGLVGAERH